MLVNIKARFSCRSPTVCAISVVAMTTLCLTGCAQAPVTDEDQVEATVIDGSDIDESNQGVITYSVEELRRTGKPDVGTALKKRDPRIN